jgi:hypothetical protein
MIAKHVPMKSAQHGGFAGLLKYITDSQSKQERVGDVQVTNCYADRADSALLEILNTQAMNTRAKADKTYHLIISFAPGESPSQEVLAAIEARVCAAIGFAQHQRISVAHHDTDSLHVHVAINKIHPQRHTIHEPFNAYYTLGQVCSKLEKEFGLQQVDHTAKKALGENASDDMERQTHVESLLGWIRRECTAPMQNAQGWSAMHAIMATHGLTIHERANGLVVSSDDGISVKASSIAREFSKASLEKKLGAFHPPASRARGADAPKHYTRQPLRSRVNTSELHARYKDEQQQITAARAAAWKNASDRKNREIDAAKRTGRLKRAAIRLLIMPSLEKKLLYAATSKTLRNEIDAISKTYLNDRQNIYEEYRRRAWADWLADKAAAGDKEALETLRARQSSGGLKGNTMRGAGSKQEPRRGAGPDSVTKNGTVIYHVGASAVRDDGSKLKVSRGADQAGLEAALRMAIDRYGSCITVNGSAVFKESIVRAAAAAQLPVRFDDATLERRRRQLTQPMKTKERTHEHASRSDNDAGRRPDRGRDERGSQNAAGRAANAARGATVAARPRSGRANGKQSNPGGARPKAPPPDAHGVRGMSEFSLVHVSHRSEMLLPGDVPGHMEPQGTKPDHRVRRHLRRPGRLTRTAHFAVPQVPRAGHKNDQGDHEVPPPSRKFEPGRVGTSIGKSTLLHKSGKRASRLKRPLNGIASRTDSFNMRSPLPGKPNVGQAGSAPPPASKDRLRPLSQLGDVTIGAHTSHVSPAPEPQLPPPVLLKEMSRLLPAERAAEKYVLEREQKRCNGFDIPKHSRYNFGKEFAAGFGGIRQIDGQALVLLKVSDEIVVKPIDESTARRLRRIPLGQQIAVQAHGAIKTKGRSR